MVGSIIVVSVKEKEITPNWRRKKQSTSQIIIMIHDMQHQMDKKLTGKECENFDGREITKWSSSFTRTNFKWNGSLISSIGKTMKKHFIFQPRSLIMTMLGFISSKILNY